MRTKLLMVVALSTAFAACSTGSKSDRPVAGPIILNPRSTPDTIELNRYFQAKDPHHFFVEVKDYGAEVVDVRLRFKNAPIEVPMQFVGGTTWRGALSSDDLKKLAVSGESVEYEGVVTARDSKGLITRSKDEIEFEIEAPKFLDDESTG